MWASVLALLLLATSAGAQQRHVHESGLHVFPSVPCSVNLGTNTQIAAFATGMSLACKAPPVSSTAGTSPFTTMSLNGQPGGDTASIGAVSAGRGGEMDVIGGAGGNTISNLGSATAIGGEGGPVAVVGGAGGVAVGGLGTGGNGGRAYLKGGVAGTGTTAGQQGEVALVGRFVNLKGMLVIDSDELGGNHFGGATLLGDNTVLDLNSTGLPGFESSVFVLTSNDTTPANRTFTISDPNRVGRLVMLYWSSNTNKGELLDTGNVRLTGTWPDATTPGDSILTLLAVDNATWVELARSPGSTGGIAAAPAATSQPAIVTNAEIDPTTMRAEYRWLPTAFCNNATATTRWDLPTATAATPTCVTGTNIQKGVLQWADTAGGFSAQTTWLLPQGFDALAQAIPPATFEVDLVWTTPATTGNAKWTVAIVCTDTSATATDDPAFPGSGNGFGTIVTAAPGTANRVVHSMVTTPIPSSCVANTTDPRLAHLRVFRDGNDALDTIANTANLIGAKVTYYVPIVQPYNGNYGNP